MSNYDISRLVEDLVALGLYPPQAPSGGLPTGGVAGNLISKNSGVDGDASWKTPDAAGVVALGGTQVIYGAKHFNFLFSRGSSLSSAVADFEYSLINRHPRSDLAIITASQSITLTQLTSDIWVDCSAGDITITIIGSGSASNREVLFHRLDSSPNILTIVRGTGTGSPLEGTLTAGPHEILMLKGYGWFGQNKYIGRILAHP